MADIIHTLQDYQAPDPRVAINRSILYVIREIASLNLNITLTTSVLVNISNWSSSTLAEAFVYTQDGNIHRFRFSDSSGNRVAGVIIDAEMIGDWITLEADHFCVTPTYVSLSDTHLGIGTATVDTTAAAGRWLRRAFIGGGSDTVDKNWINYYFYNSDVIGTGYESYYYTSSMWLSTRLHSDGLYHQEIGQFSPSYKTHVKAYYSPDVVVTQETVDPDVRILNPDDSVVDFAAMITALEAVRDRLDETEPTGLGARMAAAVHEETGMLAMVPAFAGAAAGAVPTSLGTVATVLAAIASLLSIGGSLYNALAGLGGASTRTADGEAIEASLDRIFQNIASHRDEMERNWDITNATLTEKWTALNNVISGIKSDWRFEVTYPDPRIYTPGEVLKGILDSIGSSSGGGTGTIEVDLQPLVDAITAYQAAILSGSADYATMITNAMEALGDKYFIIDENGTRYNIATLMGYLLNHRTINIT